LHAKLASADLVDLAGIVSETVPRTDR